MEIASKIFQDSFSGGARTHLAPQKPAHEKSSNWAIFASLMLLCGGLVAGSLKTY